VYCSVGGARGGLRRDDDDDGVEDGVLVVECCCNGVSSVVDRGSQTERRRYDHERLGVDCMGELSGNTIPDAFNSA
jgi:hypothetical protein